jgi:general secretion pathway protein M
MERLKTLLSLLQTWFQRLTSREQRLVVIAGAAAAAFVLFIVFFSFATSASGYARRTEAKRVRLQEVQALAASYGEAEQARQAVERQLSTSNVRLISLVEEKGTLAGLDIRTMNPKGEMPIGDGKIVESVVEVTLTDVTIDKLVQFLSSVEQGPGVVKVKRLRLEPRSAQETITAWTTIATYSLKQP